MKTTSKDLPEGEITIDRKTWIDAIMRKPDESMNSLISHYFIYPEVVEEFLDKIKSEVPKFVCDFYSRKAAVEPLFK